MSLINKINLLHFLHFAFSTFFYILQICINDDSEYFSKHIQSNVIARAKNWYTTFSMYVFSYNKPNNNKPIITNQKITNHNNNKPKNKLIRDIKIFTVNKLKKFKHLENNTSASTEKANILKVKYKYFKLQ